MIFLQGFTVPNVFRRNHQIMMWRARVYVSETGKLFILWRHRQKCCTSFGVYVQLSILGLVYSVMISVLRVTSILLH